MSANESTQPIQSINLNQTTKELEQQILREINLYYKRREQPIEYATLTRLLNSTARSKTKTTVSEVIEHLELTDQIVVSYLPNYKDKRVIIGPMQLSDLKTKGYKDQTDYAFALIFMLEDTSLQMKRIEHNNKKIKQKLKTENSDTEKNETTEN